MRLSWLGLCLLLRAVVWGTVSGVPAGGVATLPPDAALKMGLSGGDRARRQAVEVAGMPFTRAVQGQTLVAGVHPWDVQFSLDTAAPMAEGDVLLAHFWARGVQSSDETGEVRSEFVLERAGTPYTKSVLFPIVVVNRWREFLVPFTAAEAYASGQASIRFRLGYAPQTLEIGGLELLNYGDSLDLSDLPRSGIHYTGMEPDAPWRARAEALIAAHRQGDLRVLVRTARGGPVAGATVRFQMRRHAYGFGAAVDARTLMRADADGERYRQIVETHFNRVVMENDLKWPGWEAGDRATTLRALDWLRARDIAIRGHCLVWPAWRHLPQDVAGLETRPRSLRLRVLDHIRDEAGTLAGRLVDWDVINEPTTNHDLMDILGDEAMVDWYAQTQAVDGTARLYLNDYSIVSGGGIDATHQEHYLETARFLLDAGAPLGGLGTQCHFGMNPTPPERIWAILDRLGELGLPVQATEFDIDSQDRAFQTQYLRDFMTAYFAHPATVGIVMWGFWEGKHWRPEAALWDRDWTLRPHGETWIDLVTRTWWTDETVTTDAAGRAGVHAFYGDYTVSIDAGGEPVTVDLRHEAGPTDLTVTGTRTAVTTGALRRDTP